MSIDDGRVRGAGALQGKIRTSLDGEALQLDLPNTCNIEVLSQQVQAEGSP